MEGAQIGPYRVLGDLGRGGMGRVYRAEVVGSVPGIDAGRIVALKVIHAHLLETPGFFQRFLREADVGRSVRHDNVVRTYLADALLHEGVQQNFLVMEYVEGQTLRALLEELERVPEELCRHIGREVAKGLAAIHEAGVIHRDLKPENVLITEEHVVKVMDLGVARLQDEVVRLSQTGAFVGSLEYACPEQFRSGGSEVDARSDLHALGVMLYELSTGRHPYRTGDVATTVQGVIEGKARRVGEVNPQLSPFFEEVVHTLLATDRRQRFPTAADVDRVLRKGERCAWWKDRATSIRVTTRRPLRRVRIPRETTLYGRDDELAKLRVLYDKAKAGDGQVLLVEGEAGIGKTRLVDEFVGRLSREGEDVNFLFGSSPPGGAATAAGAFSTAYREHFGEEGLEETLESYLTTTPILVPAFAAILRGASTPSGAEPLTKDSLQTVFVHATRGLAAERPTIVLIDDLHFAPEEGRALFASLAHGIPGHRILLLGTMRPGVPKAWATGITRLDHADQVSLARLGPRDLGRLLRDAFRSGRPADELRWRIAEKSDGNPFFAFEIIRGLQEGQLIRRQPDGTWVTTRAVQDIQVPSSVLDLVSARVADLTADERNLLDVAACCGFEFDPVVVGAALDLDPVPTLRALGQVERRHRLVRSRGRRYVFDHHQVQEALYGALNEYLREAYHAALAEALETHAGAADADPKTLKASICVELCDQFLKGGRGEQALRYLDASLGHLEKAFRNDQAIVLADRALDVPDLLRGRERCRVLLRKNDRLELLGRREAQEALLAEARACAERAGETECLAEVERRTGGLLWFLGHYEQAREHAERDLALTRETGDRRGEALALMNLGGNALNEGHLEEAREHLANSAALAREVGDRSIEARATGSLGHVLYAQGRFAEAQGPMERHLALAREDGDRRGEGWAAGNLGLLFVGLGRYEEGLSRHERHLAIARETGDRRGEGIALGNLGILFFGLGLYGDAREHYARCLAIAREVRGRDLEVTAQLGLGSVWLPLGRTVRARRALEACLALCRKTGARRWEGYALSDLGAVAGEEGDGAAALDLADEALTLHRQAGDNYGVANALSQLGELRWRAGDGEGAREALGEAVTLLRAQQRKGSLAAALALLACLPEGNVEAAEAALADAGTSGDTPEVRYHLWKATGRRPHLDDAKRLLDDRLEHAPVECRESMRKHVRLHREILEAWASTDRE